MGCRSWPVHRVFAPADAGQNRIRVTEKQILEEEGQVSKITPKQEKKVEMDIIRVEIRYTPERQADLAQMHSVRSIGNIHW